MCDEMAMKQRHGLYLFWHMVNGTFTAWQSAHKFIMELHNISIIT